MPRKPICFSVSNNHRYFSNIHSALLMSVLPFQTEELKLGAFQITLLQRINWGFLRKLSCFSTVNEKHVPSLTFFHTAHKQRQFHNLEL